MALFIFIFIILPILAGLLWWYLILFRPLHRARKLDENYSINHHILLSISLSAIVYMIIYSSLDGYISPIFIIIMAVLTPPAVMVWGVIMVFHVHFWAFAVSTIIVLIAVYVALQMSPARSRLAITLLAVIPMCAIPITVQGFVSVANIKSEFERLEGDCLRMGTFVQSLKNADVFTDTFHAVAIKGEDAFNWSYSQYAFVPLNMDKRQALYYAPTRECRQ